MSSNAPFDQVIITDGLATQRLSCDQFRALPLEKRLKLLLVGQLKFFLGGKEVPAKEAIRRV